MPGGPRSHLSGGARTQFGGFRWLHPQGGQVFNPAVALIFVLKTFFFSLAVSFIPVLSGLNTMPSSGRRSELPEVQGLLRMFLLILLIELVSLVGNYY